VSVQTSTAAPEAAAAATAPLIRVRGLTVAYDTERGLFPAVRDVSLDVPRSEVTAIIGESGSGKTTLALGMLNAVSKPGRVVAGTVEFDGVGDVLRLKGDALRRFRGRDTGMVFQASQNVMNPLTRIGSQILDLGRSHGHRNPRELVRTARDLAARMSLPADRVLTAYQHQLSGGMRQRVGIIMALLLNPRLVVLDEPTTALDILSQSQVLDIIKTVYRERHLTGLLITHDLGVVAELSHHVVVLYGGRVAERGRTQEVLRRPRHPYTRALIKAIPRLTGDVARAEPLLGSPPSLDTIPADGCVFRARCPLAEPRCATGDVPVRQGPDGHDWACWVETEEVAQGAH
jgi:peptide/nickel transport system ATP-binding protein